MKNLDKSIEKINEINQYTSKKDNSKTSPIHTFPETQYLKYSLHDINNSNLKLPFCDNIIFSQIKKGSFQNTLNQIPQDLKSNKYFLKFDQDIQLKYDVKNINKHQTYSENQIYLFQNNTKINFQKNENLIHKLFKIKHNNSKDEQSHNNEMNKLIQDNCNISFHLNHINLIENQINSKTQYLSNSKQKNYETNFEKNSVNLIIDKNIFGCNCKRSKCLKLYCDCLSQGKYCENCNCIDCHNTEIFKGEREETINKLKMKQPEKFKENIILNNIVKNKGCKCLKSNCKKKYCECFQNGSICTEFCKCKECLNNTLGKNIKLKVSTYNDNIIKKEDNVFFDKKQSIQEEGVFAIPYLYNDSKIKHFESENIIFEKQSLNDKEFCQNKEYIKEKNTENTLIIIGNSFKNLVIENSSICFNKDEMEYLSKKRK